MSTMIRNPLYARFKVGTMAAAVALTVQAKLRQIVNVADFGAIGDGLSHPLSERFASLGEAQAVYPHAVALTDEIDWAAIQATINAGKSAEIAEGIFSINRAISFAANVDFSGRGFVLRGAGRRRTLIKNTSTAAPLVDFGNLAANQDALDCGLFALSLQGNALSTYGIRILGDDDHGLTQASRGVSIDQVRVSDVGAGPALLISAWVPNVGYLETQNNLRGIEIGNHVYAGKVAKFYNINATNEAIYIADSVTSAKSCQVVFENAVLQACGATGQAVYLGGAAGVVIRQAYVENLNAAATAVIRVGVTNRNSRIEDLFYTRGTGPATVDIVDTASPSLIVDGVDGRGDVRSFVKITGTNVGTRIANLEQPTGLRTLGWVDDQSANKRTSYTNPKYPDEQRQAPLSIWASTVEFSQRWINRASGAVQAFMQNGRLYFGADDTALNLSAAGSTLNVWSGSAGAYGTSRAEQFRLGTSNAKFSYYTSTPEGAITADPGSLCAVTTSASAGLWAKATGTAATGWIKIA